MESVEGYALPLIVCAFGADKSSVDMSNYILKHTDDKSAQRRIL